MTILPHSEWYPGAVGFFAMPEEAYRAVLAVNQSMLKRCARSPQATRRPYPATKQMDTGSLAHMLLLEPDRFKENVSHLIKPTTYPSDKGEKPWSGNSTWCKAWMESAELRGLPVLSRDDEQKVRNMVDAFRTDPLGSQFVENGHFEVAAFAHDPDTGDMLKARLDIVTEGEDKIWICDTKFTGEGDPAEFGKIAFRFDYAVQAAFYINVVSLLADAEVKMLFATVETGDPHMVDFHTFSRVDILEADARWRHYLGAYLAATKSDDWTKINEVRLPNWQR